MNFEPPPNHGTDAQDENLELADGYLLRIRHRAILPYFGPFISSEKNHSQQQLNFILTCLPTSHKTLYEHIEGVILLTVIQKKWTGKVEETYTSGKYRMWNMT